jgi:hypothetical protein
MICLRAKEHAHGADPLAVAVRRQQDPHAAGCKEAPPWRGLKHTQREAVTLDCTGVGMIGRMIREG